MKRLRIVLAVLAALLLAGLVYAQQDGDDLYYVSIVLPVNVRTSATTTSPVIGSLLPGEGVRVTGSVSGERINESSLWYIVDYEGRVGYVHSTFLSNPNAATPTVAPTFTPLPPVEVEPDEEPESAAPVESPAASDETVEMVDDCRVADLMNQMRSILLETTLEGEEAQFQALMALAEDVRAMEAACEALFGGGGVSSPTVIEQDPVIIEEDTAPVETPEAEPTVFDENAAG